MMSNDRLHADLQANVGPVSVSVDATAWNLSLGSTASGLCCVLESAPGEQYWLRYGGTVMSLSSATEPWMLGLGWDPHCGEVMKLGTTKNGRCREP